MASPLATRHRLTQPVRPIPRYKAIIPGSILKNSEKDSNAEEMESERNPFLSNNAKARIKYSNRDRIDSAFAQCFAVKQI